MPDSPLEFNGSPENWVSNLDSDLVIVEGGFEDTTVRPINESQRRALERRGLIPPTPPPTPPAEKE